MQSTVLLKFPPKTNATPAQQARPLGWQDDAILHFSQLVQKLVALPGLRIEDRFAAITAAACNVFEMDYGYITLIRKQKIEVAASSGLCLLPKTVQRTHLNNAFSQSLISDKLPLLLADTTRSAQDGMVDLTGKAPARFLGVPLLFDGTVYGTFELSGHAQARAFDANDLAATYFLSAIIATPLALLGGY